MKNRNDSPAPEGCTRRLVRGVRWRMVRWHVRYYSCGKWRLDTVWNDRADAEERVAHFAPRFRARLKRVVDIIDFPPANTES